MLRGIERFVTRHTSRFTYFLRNYTRGLYGARKELDEVREMTREQLLELQDRKLRQLIEHCRENVPFYRQWFQGRDFPTNTLVRDSNVWKELPVLTKRDIQTQAESLVARNAHRGEMYKNATGGSTGEPLNFWQDDNYRRHNAIDRYRSFEMCGWRPGDRVAHLWGAELDAAEHVGIRGFVSDRFIHNRVFINTFNLEGGRMDVYLDALLNFAPEFVIGYASSLDLFADAINNSNVRIAPKAVQSSADMLGPKARTRIEQAFNAPVFDRYGCRECGIIAHECELHTGLHIFSNTHLVEILNDDSTPTEPGEMGNIVATNLNNYAMPFVRYMVGDVGGTAQGECPCGRALPRVGQLGGRTTATIRLPSGRVMHGEYFAHLFYDLEAIKRFQVIQHKASQIEIRLALYPGYEREEVNGHLRTTIARQLGDEFQLEINFDKEFEIQGSGKRQHVISKVDTA